MKRWKKMVIVMAILVSLVACKENEEGKRVDDSIIIAGEVEAREDCGLDGVIYEWDDLADGAGVAGVKMERYSGMLLTRHADGEIMTEEMYFVEEDDEVFQQIKNSVYKPYCNSYARGKHLTWHVMDAEDKVLMTMVYFPEEGAMEVARDGQVEVYEWDSIDFPEQYYVDAERKHEKILAKEGIEE